MVPSFLAPILIRDLVPETGPVARNTSLRVSAIFTGRLALRASWIATGSPEKPVLPPKPPPISDCWTRILADSILRMVERLSGKTQGACVDHHSSITPSAEQGTTPRRGTP